jgi:hypothetical protein
MFVDSPYPHGSFWLDVVDKGVKAIAVAIGGLWTLWHFQRRRTYKVRLELGISGQIFCADNESYLVIACTLKNVGLSKVDLNEPETRAEVHLLKSTGRDKLRRFEVFRSHEWIESGESVADSVVLPLPAPETYVALQMDLKVMSKESQPRTRSRGARRAYYLRLMPCCKVLPRSQGYNLRAHQKDSLDY